MVKISRQPSLDKEEGKAYPVYHSGELIGYIPLLETLRGYFREAPTNEAKNRINKWGLATVDIRAWLESRETYHFEDEWIGSITKILYLDGEKHVEHDTGTIAAVSIGMDEIV